MNSAPGIALTGIGVISPLGTEAAVFFRYLGSGELPPEGPLPEPGHLIRHLKIADPKLKIARYMDPVSKNAIIAVGRALQDAGVAADNLAADPCDYGLVLGATRGACITREGLYGSLAQREGRMVSGTLFSHCGYNVAGAMTAIAYGLKGPNLTVAARGDLGWPILRRARQFLLSGRAQTILAGFSESGGVLRPGSRLFHEFAYFLCLEKKERAAARGARVLAEVTLAEENGPSLPPEGGSLVYGWQSGPQGPADAAQTVAFPLPGLAACGEQHRSLLLLGLLARHPELRQGFAAVAFGIQAGTGNGVVRLLFEDGKTG